MSDKVAVDTLRYLQVLESGQRHRLPDWLVWNADASLLDGVATEKNFQRPSSPNMGDIRGQRKNFPSRPSKFL